jgi:hypothetical protein|tara:strand:- start:265 stop:723 length:459 start_codon:yes stop_codon:yes gene_type:complete
MKSFKQYITEAKTVKKVDYDDAYWQPSKSNKVEIGTKVGRFKGRPRWKQVEKIFEKERPRNLPSRLGNIYVAATENNVMFEKSKPVFIVQMTGKAFYANLELFTDAVSYFAAKDINKVRELAKQYWEGVDHNKPNKYTEIILDGEAEVSYKL